MGQLMETIQVVSRGQEAIARGQEEVLQANQRAAAANPHTPTPATPTSATLTVQIPIGTPVGVPPPVGGGPMNQNGVPVVNPHVLEVDNQDDAFFSPRDESTFNAFEPASTEIERKVCVIEEKMKEIKGSNIFGLDAT